MESWLLQSWAIGKWFIAILGAIWMGNRYMNSKQQYILGLYFTYCFINGYAVAAAIIPHSANTLSPEAFILGLSGAVCACAWLQKIDSSPKTYSSLMLSMLIAGTGSHAASKWFIGYCGCLDMESLYYITPLLIGAAIPTLVPIGLAFVNNTWGKGSKNA